MKHESERDEALRDPPPYTRDLEALVGRRVRQLRELRGLSQQQFAEQMSLMGWQMHQTTVGKVENATRPLRVNELHKLAAFFEVPMPSLWASNLSPNGFSPETLDRFRKLLTDMEAQTPALQQRADELAEARDHTMQEWSAAASRLNDHLAELNNVRAALAQLQEEFEGDDGERREEA